MKQKKNTPLIVPVLWFITTGLWTITFSMNLLHFSLSEGIVGLHGCWSHWLPPSSISPATNQGTNLVYFQNSSSTVSQQIRCSLSYLRVFSSILLRSTQK